MPTAKKPTRISKPFPDAQIAAARRAADEVVPSRREPADWRRATLTPGGGVGATIAALRSSRGANRKPTKEQVAIRLDQDVVGALRASGPGWQTRVNAALRDWLATQPPKADKPKRPRAA